MTSPRRGRPRTHRSSPSAALDATSIDTLYGLEPIFEPGQTDEATSSAAGTQPQSVQCPYCGEYFETLVDVSAGSASYIEDCQICCQPIQFNLEVDSSGTLLALTALRSD